MILHLNGQHIKNMYQNILLKLLGDSDIPRYIIYIHKYSIG